jgi:ABC-type Na+ transport system ATPase subunit NatA
MRLLGLAGLTEVAHERVGDFSLGTGQRLGVAAALLGESAEGERLLDDDPGLGRCLMLPMIRLA